MAQLFLRKVVQKLCKSCAKVDAISGGDYRRLLDCMIETISMANQAMRI